MVSILTPVSLLNFPIVIITDFSLESVVTTDVSIAEMDNPQEKRSGWLAKGGVLTSVFAVVGASCCILPIILVNIGVSSALVSHLGIFVRLRPWLIALSIAFIIAAFIFTFRGGRRPNQRTLAVLIIAAVLTLCALMLPYYEGGIQRWLNLTGR